MQLTITTLGGLEIKKGETAVSGFVSRKAEALFVYLACQQRPITRHTLATLLWDDLSQERSLANLSVLLNSLRKQLDAFLLVSRNEVALDPHASWQLDVQTFTQKITAVRQQQQRTPLPQLVEAAQLYRGEFLAGFAVKEAAGFDEWLLLERERLGWMAIETFDMLVRCTMEAKVYQTSLEYTIRLLQLDPLREEAHRQKMHLLLLTGQRGAAVEQFEICRRILHEELGVTPDAETVALYETIKTANPENRAILPIPQTDNGLTAPARPALLHNLPSQVTPFLGREAELAEIRSKFETPACRLLTLIGPGGAGKTRLMLQAAQEQVGNFAHGVWLVSLAGVHAAEFLVSAVAAALNFSFASSGDGRHQLLAYLRDKSLLLALDNFEHLLEGVDLLGDILHHARGVKLLVTSRERLNLQAEWLLGLEGLPYPTGAVTLNTSYSAVELFLQRARQIDHTFTLTAENQSAIFQICRLVNGMPLGIELAAAHIHHYTCTEIATAIAHNLDFLTTSLRDVPARHRSLRAVFDYSWQRLSGREQQTFAACASFQNGFSQEAARQVAGATAPVLAALLDKSLLKRDNKGRYQIHELVRQYAEDQLRAAGAETAVAEHHATCYAAQLARLQADLVGPRHEAALAAIETDLENVRRAWEWGVSQRRLDILSQMTEGISYFYEGRGRFQEGETLYRYTLSQLMPEYGRSIPPTAHNQRFLSRCYTWQGSFNDQMACLEEGINQLQTALHLLEDPVLAQTDVRNDKAFILWNLAFGYNDFYSDIPKAQQTMQQSLELWQQTGHKTGIMSVLRALGGMRYEFGDYEEAITLFRRSLAMAQEVGYRKAIANAQAALGLTLLYVGQLKEGETLLYQSVTTFREIQNWEGVAFQLLNLGVAHALAGTFVAARQSWQEGLLLVQEMGVRDDEAHLTTLLGFAALHLGEYDQARRYGQAGLELAQSVRFQRIVALSWLLLGSAALAQGDWGEAQRCLEESMVNYRSYPRRDELAWALATMVYVMRQIGNQPAAEVYLTEAIHLVQEIRPFIAQMVLLPVCALWQADKGETEQAVELYAIAARHHFVQQSRWFAEVAGQTIEGVIGRLPPETIKLCQQRAENRGVSEALNSINRQ